jgi:hypothetical protein
VRVLLRSQWVRTGVAVVLALASVQAQAAVYSCEGSVGNVTTARGGDLLLETFAGSSWMILCNLTTTLNGMTPDQCKTVYSQLLAAQLAGKKVRLWFNDNLTCSTQGGWQVASGWYFGPTVMD